MAKFARLKQRVADHTLFGPAIIAVSLAGGYAASMNGGTLSAPTYRIKDVTFGTSPALLIGDRQATALEDIAKSFSDAAPLDMGTSRQVPALQLTYDLHENATSSSRKTHLGELSEKNLSFTPPVEHGERYVPPAPVAPIVTEPKQARIVPGTGGTVRSALPQEQALAPSKKRDAVTKSGQDVAGLATPSNQPRQGLTASKKQEHKPRLEAAGSAASVSVLAGSQSLDEATLSQIAPGSSLNLHTTSPQVRSLAEAKGNDTNDEGALALVSTDPSLNRLEPNLAKWEGQAPAPEEKPDVGIAPPPTLTSSQSLEETSLARISPGSGSPLREALPQEQSLTAVKTSNAGDEGNRNPVKPTGSPTQPEAVQMVSRQQAPAHGAPLTDASDKLSSLAGSQSLDEARLARIAPGITDKSGLMPPEQIERRNNLNAQLSKKSNLSEKRDYVSGSYIFHVANMRINGVVSGSAPIRIGQDEKPHIQVKDLLISVRDIMDSAILSKFSASDSAAEYVSFSTLREMGINVSYDPASDELRLSAD